jgi:hypothetical protein
VGAARLFSGRPDPEWRVAPEIAGELERIWEALGPWSGPLPQPPRLGYRGCLLRDAGGGEFFAFGGAVVLKRPGFQHAKGDPARRFEKRLLSSAPQGLLPVSWEGG